MADLLDKAILIGMGLERKAREVLDELEKSGKANKETSDEAGLPLKEKVENKVVDVFAYNGNIKDYYPKPPFAFAGMNPSQLSGLAIGENILSITPNPKIAVVRFNNTYGEEGVKYGLEQGGGQLVANISFDPMASDLTPQAVAAAAAKPDWVGGSRTRNGPVLAYQGPAAGRRL